MRKQSLTFDNLGDVVKAAKNATRLGTQQFETPSAIAEALMLPLTRCRPIVTDFQCGHGALLLAARTPDTRHLLGLDIDPTAQVPKHAQFGLPEVPASIIHGDINQIVPLLRDVNWQADLLTLNPPFSLQWPDGDSTMVTWNLAHEFLSAYGEGMMICNEPTARRFFGKKGAPHARRIWLWVTMPNFFPGTDSSMEIAVIYFAADHTPYDDGWIDLRIHSAQPDAVRDSLRQFARSSRQVRGQTARREFEADSSTANKWRAVMGEWKRMREEHLGKRVGWNIRLDATGRLDVWLTPFQQLSGKVPKELVKELAGLHGKYPASLVVQKPSRLALQRAVSGGIWRVEPAVLPIVEKAVREYHAVRAPFSHLGPVQRLAYLDEEDTITCKASGDGFTEGQSYQIVTETFEGRKLELRPRPGYSPEEVLVTGQELVIRISDDDGRRHSYTQFAPTAEEGDSRPKAGQHHTLTELVAQFHIPEVPDVATVNPAAYQTYKARMLALQH
jgi:predicted RNA methylase